MKQKKSIYTIIGHTEDDKKVTCPAPTEKKKYRQPKVTDIWKSKNSRETQENAVSNKEAEHQMTRGSEGTARDDLALEIPSSKPSDSATCEQENETQSSRSVGSVRKWRKHVWNGFQ